MYHHDSRPYDVAVDDTAKAFQARLEEQIHRGRPSAEAVLEKLEREVPVDRVVRGDVLTFAAGPDRIMVGALGNFSAPLHRHALGQLGERAGIPDTYLSRLLERPYGAQLIVENLQTIYAKEEPKKYLVREFDGEVRGFLSNSYKRMADAPIVLAFAKACANVGAVLIDGVGGDLRWAIRAVLPRVFQPSIRKGSEEFISIGVQLSSSSVGMGALSLRLTSTRAWCSNLAALTECLRATHLGSRLDENVEFSHRTHRLDTDTQISAVEDMVKEYLSPARVNELVARIGQALERRIDPKTAWEGLPRLGLLKSEVESVKQVFLDGGVEMLPPGTTVARLSNAISWFAKSAPPERRLELENTAGKLLLGGALSHRSHRERVAA